MNICLVNHFYPPDSTGGVETYTSGIARILRSRGHVVSIFTGGKWAEGATYIQTPRDTLEEGVLVRRIDFNWTLAPDPFRYLYDNPEAARAFEQYLDSTCPDIVHVMSTYTLSASVITAAKTHGYPVLLTLHDYWFICPRTVLLTGDDYPCNGHVSPSVCLNCMTSGSKIQRWSSRLLGKRGSLALMEKIAQLPIFTRQRGLVGMVGDYQDRRKTLSAALAQVDRILLPSPFMRPFYAGHGLPEEKMKVIQEGIDTGWFSGLIARIESDRLRIAYLGQVRPAKGVHLLIEAAQGLRGNYRVRVYGNMRQDPAYAARLVDAAGKNSNIEFPGGYTRAQLEPILMDTDIVVLPSISMEPFGIIAREALFAGVPVVASNTGGLVDVVQPGINGALCPPGDMTALKKILQALVDDPRRLVNLRQPSGKIRGMAEEVDELEQEYQAILAGQKPEKHKHLEGCR